jgi:outer membrane immunogenic protein
MPRLSFIAALLSSTVIITPAYADASMDELKARVERAERENLKLKAEKIERENLMLKAEALEQENEKLRADASKQKTNPVAQNTPVKQKPAHVAFAKSGDTAALRAVNDALASMPKDDPRREMTAKAVAVSSVETVAPAKSSWTGIYVGVNGGYGYNDANYSTSSGYGVGNYDYNFSGGQSDKSSSVTYSSNTNPLTVNGPLAGGQVGYNYQFANNMIIGAEADMDYTDFSNNSRYSRNVYASVSGNSNGSSANMYTGNNYNRVGVDWLGTIRGRVGYAIGSFLPYATAGFAYGGLSSSASSQNGTTFGSYSTSNSYSQAYGMGGGSTNSNLGIGWAAGVGAEYLIANNWSMKAEYLYTSIGDLYIPGTITTSNNTGSTSNGSSSGGGGRAVNYSTGYIANIGVHQARFGLNYHTEWLAVHPTVAAKY